MSSLPSIFITYNPKSLFERTLAIRLHTLGNVHGYRMYLPDRTERGTGVTPETRSRIAASEYFILFSTSKPSPTVEEEINIAWLRFSDKSRILLIYDQQYGGKNLTNTDHFTEIVINSRTMATEEITQHVIDKLALHHYQTEVARLNREKSQANRQNNAFGGLVLAGLGLLMLGANDAR